MDIHTGKALSFEDSLNQSIILILLTPKGERVLNRNFGSRLFRYMDAPINIAASFIPTEAVSSLKENDTRLKPTGAQISYANNSMSLKVFYGVNGESETDVKLT